MAFFYGTVTVLCCLHKTRSSRVTELYNPKAVFTHAALLRQAFAHCGRFPTAASRRSLDRLSVPMWPVDLSVRLPVFGLVSRYLTNCLIGHKSLQKRISAFHLPAYEVLAPVSRRCPSLSDKSLCFTHPSAA